MGRSCTSDFKIQPIIKKTRRLVGAERMKAWRAKHRQSLKALSDYQREKRLAKKEKRNPGLSFPREAFSEMQADALVVQWIGISLDEATRMKPSRDPWSRHEWPLVERRMTRNDCLLWMKRRGFPKAPRSACKYCPFHSDAEWIRLRDEEPDEFLESVRVERAMQNCHTAIVTPGKMKGVAFLHESLVPLDEVDFSTDSDHGQKDLFQNECEGMCGL
jgi:hypothetical protein